MNLSAALNTYGSWRLHEANFSVKTWAGEKPGLLDFVDLMRARDVLDVDQLTHGDLSAWFAYTQDRLSAATVPTRLAQLRSFLGFCRAKGWLEGDPTALLRAEAPARRQRERLTAGELLELPAWAGTPQRRIIVALCCNLGLRASEVRELRVKDVHLDRGEIHVRVSKTDTDEDAMPITAELDLELRGWLTTYTRECPALTRDSYLVPSVYVSNINRITTYRHDRPMGKNHVARTIQEALEAFGWESTLQEGGHTIRRSLARVYFDYQEAQAGFDSALLATMELLHHAKADTTLRYIGKSRGRNTRDHALKGKPFLTQAASGQSATLVAV